MTKSEIFDIVKRNALEVLDVPPEEVSPERSLAEIGANSMDRMEIVTLTMEELGLKIPFMSFASASNIGDLVDILSRNVE